MPHPSRTLCLGGGPPPLVYFSIQNIEVTGLRFFGVYPSDEPRRLNAKAQRMAGHRASFVPANWRGCPIHRVLCDEWGNEADRAVSFAWWCGRLRYPTHAA